ncbi:MAG: hypothetical protein MJ105_04780 [Lachnospiraceae bacterium]|nr:hypothetical protein [Lachnospiraceae bacterium]
MGFGEMMGIKTVKIATKEAMDIEAFYNSIKDIAFEAGTPEYTKHGLGYLIAFPKVDNENQVWITGSKGKFVIQRSTVIAGVGNMIASSIKADVKDKLTFGVSGLKSTFGSPKKQCMAQVDEIAAKIQALGL